MFAKSKRAIPAPIGTIQFKKEVSPLIGEHTPRIPRSKSKIFYRIESEMRKLVFAFCLGSRMDLSSPYIEVHTPGMSEGKFSWDFLPGRHESVGLYMSQGLS